MHCSGSTRGQWENIPGHALTSLSVCISALVVAVWTVTACLFLSETPKDHRFVSIAEQKYLADQPHMKKTEEKEVGFYREHKNITSLPEISELP